VTTIGAVVDWYRSDYSGNERRTLSTRTLVIVIGAHVAALVFGLAGLLIAVPNPHLWADSELGIRVYRFGMSYAGAIHIIFATIAMLIVGAWYIGMRKTLIFFGLTFVISLSAELIGTNTGFPFGDYTYTSGLGYQILDDVPFTIPMSWFYMGLASYILAIVLVGTGPGWKRPVAAILGGAALLTIWDLVLDPAMAHQDLDVRFWIWHQSGSYFGMPAQNFLGWMFVGVIFMGASRIAWGSDGSMPTRAIVLPSYVIYLANLVFAMVISAAVGLWWPIIITLVIGVIPATFALLRSQESVDDQSGDSTRQGTDPVRVVSHKAMSTGAGVILARSATVRFEGLENIPKTGPGVIVARHYHHLLDGCVLVRSTSRPIHLLVAIDWVRSQWQRRLLERLCTMAGWPTIIRPDSENQQLRFSGSERTRYLRAAMQDTIELLREGSLVVIFPEGYPTVDPHSSRKTDSQAILPFQHGFVSIVRQAEKRFGTTVPIIPAGFDYQRASNRWEITVRFGKAIECAAVSNPSDLVELVENRVRSLSVEARVSERAVNHGMSEST
jgi:uncharacterized membrane protein/1-acyl-sn-glycerol-3-phosphate acyltransferase